MSVIFPRETFFLARTYPFVRPSVFRQWVFFLFATELVTERGVTNDYYTDGRVPLVTPSVIISPTEFIPVTDGISPSVKLFNGVVNSLQNYLKDKFIFMSLFISLSLFLFIFFNQICFCLHCLYFFYFKIAIKYYR
jgi:hypothetical protein